MKKNKKFFKYTQCFKVIEQELTWDLFLQYLNEHMEFCFYYKKLTIDIAFHYEGQKKKYELNITGEEASQYLTFDTIEELIAHRVFDNQSLYDIWEELEL